MLGGLRGGARLESSSPALSARQAYARTLVSLDRAPRVPAIRARGTGAQKTTRFSGNGHARLVAYHAGGRLRLAWRVVAPVSRSGDYDALVDATTGRVVRRSNLVRFADALVFDNHPGAAVGGTQQRRPIGQWLRPRARRLIGNNAHAFRDVDDVVGTQITEDAIIDFFTPPRSGDVPPSRRRNWLYPLQPVADPQGFCPPAPGCTWNHLVPFSWQVNDEQATTQLFYFVNRFHDHLLAPPIGFDEASGNFEQVNTSGTGDGGDHILAQSEDGANTNGAGLPDDNHIDNANFDTRPDGIPGRMQMYLWEPIPLAENQFVPFAAVDGSNDPEIVWHEYGHGLSNRLITDVQGFGAVAGTQSGAMGEAWSDWFALDLLARDGLIADSVEVGDVKLGDYVDGGNNLIRSEPLDCPPDQGSPACPGFPETGPGGYTYADFGRIAFGLPGGVELPEPHADGEIWAQTLWQLRQALVARYGAQGSNRAERYISGGMRLGPAQPSFLDQRNAILQADTVAGGRDQELIWQVFASRGMGFFASTRGDNDGEPVADFSLPPAAGGAAGVLAGTVRDDAGRPLAGVRVGLGGHDAPPAVGPALQAVTDADGAYRIDGIPAATYPHVTAMAPDGYADVVDGPVTIGTTSVARDLTVRRNWADARAGAAISTDARDESAFACGPDKLVDGDSDTAVDTASPDDPDTEPVETVPRAFTVTLPRAIDGAEVWINPTYGCYNLATSSLGAYTLLVSTDGATFTPVADGSFDRTDLWRLNRVPARGMPNGVRAVRLVARSTQAGAIGIPDFGFLSLAELQVYARPGTP